ncbi:hypothetical protein MYCTH_2295130 [Thermothelomyces thermophilus ATCC 42464]|uniref:Uncharacterized protein n=1 Tax=Thermothelomyces thermophilus (strain ATCC 42464 / BCRC 31852 / DSM 1799) TaxID=573729 RepID=G2Q3N5_THET4|nr:uncharacterized protein MYCTH_2295130 [Thermothelomyces thermophilus ATCC 42464]AEO53591.1 hypothetical protein MYCTH_2295130 [Thermothelomyces thermophilus ATCC 42464]
MNPHSGPATLPRGFKCPEYEAPRTPEPFPQTDDVQIPSAPRPRLKLRRRVVSQLSAPTQHFLASVAAADVPIPSIEEPEIAADDYDTNATCPFPEFRYEPDEGDMNFLRPQGRGLPAPKTPAPEFESSLPTSQYPNWTIDSISSVESTPEPDYESSRPSTSRSTQTSASSFSRFSLASEDDHYDNYDVEEESKDKDNCPLTPNEVVPLRDPAGLRGKARKAPWTKAMSDHLWSTFMLYLQDPKVTPFRMGKGCIPPHGVCLRVAREAKRSWKGSKAWSTPTNSGEDRKSGSATPTAESSGTFIQWPHTCAATRAHLRELCRLKAGSWTNNYKFTSRNITPFTQAAARHWNRRSTPARSPAPFATRDMSLSLAMSTSESMQPNGPLAQLAASHPEPPEPTRSPPLAGQTLRTFEGEPSFAERRRLGSPFNASSYGPSSSGSLAAVLGLTGSIPRRQSQTVGPRRTLQSPVRLSRSGTQKRRHTQSGVPRKRPSIGSDLWLDPSFGAASTTTTTTSCNSEKAAATSSRSNKISIPKIPSVPTLSSSASMPNVGGQRDDSVLLPPPRLGSPFTGESTNFSFPHRAHRMHQGASIDLGVLGRPFATVQHFSPPSNSPSTRNSLADRLAYIDQRLSELRQRDTHHQPESPL